MAEIGSGYISLLPSARGFGTATQRQVGPQLTRSGAVLGAGLGKSMLKGFIAIGVGVKIAQFFGDALSEAREAQKVGALTANVIRSTGGAAKVAQVQVERLTQALSTKVGIDDEEIQAGSNLILTFKNIKREGTGLDNIFARATRAGVDLAASGFGSITSASKQIGKALNDPIKGLTALGRAGVTFTAQETTQIKNAVAHNNILRAQRNILREVESQVGGAAAAQATGADKARVALANLKEQIGTALLPAVDAMANLFANKVAPAISGFITNLQTGKGQAGAFGTFIRTQVMPALHEFGDFLVAKVLPAVRDALISGLHNARSAFNSVRDAVRENRPQLEQLAQGLKKVAGFILTQLIPAIIKIQSKWLPVLGAAIRAIITAAAFWVDRFNQAKAVTLALSRVAANAVTGFQVLAVGVRQKAANVLTTMKALPGKIKSALGSLGHLLYAAGQSVVQGLIDGIVSKIGALTSKLHQLTSLIPKHKGPPAKDKGLLYGAGQLIIEGLIDGMTSKEDALTKKLKETTKKIKDHIASLRSDFASLVEPIASNFTQGLFDFDTASLFTANLTVTKATLTGLLANFAKLKGEGLSPGFLYQLFQSGGPKLIAELAALDTAGAQNASTLFGDVQSLSTQLGTAVAGATDKGAAIENQTQRLEKKLDKLTHHVDQSAREFAAAVNGAASSGRRRAA